MSNEMHELAASTLAAAREAGAGDARVALSRSRFVEVEYRERKAEKLKEAATRGLNLETFVAGRYSSQSTSDLRPDALSRFVRDAVAATRLLAADPFRTLPDPGLYAGRPDADLQAADPGFDSVTADERHRMARTIEAACLEAGGAKVVSATAVVRDSRSETLVVTTNGFTGMTQTTDFTAGATMTVQDEGDRRPAEYHFLSARRRAALPEAAELGRAAARRTLDLLGARKMPTATLPVIVENRSVPRLLGGLLAAMLGRNVQQKRSFLADKMGQRVGSERLTLVDDPLLAGGLGSRLFDGDGFPSRRRTLIEAGVLRDLLVDWYYSRKLGREPTTGGPSNLVVPPGTRSLATIMKDLGRGLVVTSFIGGNSNSATGDTSAGVVGYLFEGGVRTQPIAEMNIADNHLKFWHKLAEVADDPWVYSSWRIPSLVFTDVVVSGT